MNNITDDEINKVLAEFMGFKSGGWLNVASGRITEYGVEFTHSLDECVQVVKKLGFVNLRYIRNTSDGDFYEWVAMTEGGNFCNDKSPSRALATALYFAVKELE